ASDGIQHPLATKNRSDLNLRICDRMLRIFAKRAMTGVYFKKKKSATVKCAYAFFDQKLKEQVDWYLTAEETVFYGLADGILWTKAFPDLQAIRQTVTEPSK